MIKIDNSYYYLDLEAIEAYVFKKDMDRPDKVEEVQTFFDSDGKLSEKTVVQKHNYDDKQSQMRYDMIKSMLDTTYNSGIESENGDVSYITEMEKNSIGANLIFNTLLINGFVKDKLD